MGFHKRRERLLRIQMNVHTLQLENLFATNGIYQGHLSLAAAAKVYRVDTGKVFASNSVVKFNVYHVDRYFATIGTYFQ